MGSGIITLDALAAQTPNSEAAKRDLTTLGFNGGYQHVWMNRDIHESIVVGDGEYGSPTAAAIHKIAVEHSWASQNRTRFPVPDIPGAVGTQNIVQLPGKYPESEYSVVFRIERWEFAVTVGNAVGPSGMVPATPALARQIADQELATVRPVLSKWMVPPAVDGSLVLRDDTCRCSIGLPATWDVVPYQPNLLAPGVQQALSALPPGSDAFFPSAGALSQELGKHLIFAGRDTSSETAVLFARLPTRDAGSNQMEQLANLFGALGANNSTFPETKRIDLPVGKITQVTLSPFVTGPLAGATETLSAFEHGGWTYLVGFVTLDPAANQATSDTILRSVRVGGP